MIKEEKRRLRVSNIKSARLNDLKRFIKKQIKNVKNGELQFSAKGIKKQKWLSFKYIHVSGWQDVFI
jgi:hypothetical protein